MGSAYTASPRPAPSRGSQDCKLNNDTEIINVGIENPKREVDNTKIIITKNAPGDCWSGEKRIIIIVNNIKNNHRFPIPWISKQC